MLPLRGNRRLDYLIHSDRRTGLFPGNTAINAVPRSPSASSHCSRAQHSESRVTKTNRRSLRSILESCADKQRSMEVAGRRGCRGSHCNTAAVTRDIRREG